MSEITLSFSEKDYLERKTQLGPDGETLTVLVAVGDALVLSYRQYNKDNGEPAPALMMSFKKSDVEAKRQQLTDEIADLDAMLVDIDKL